MRPASAGARLACAGLIVATPLGFSKPAATQAQAQEPASRAPAFADTLETRVFPLFAMLRTSSGWAVAIRTDPALRRLAAERAARVPAADCTPAPQCLAGAWVWTPGDIAAVAARLRALAGRPELARALIAGRMRPSGRFARHAALADADFLAAAWSDAAAAINRVVALYGKGEAPRYPKIDAIIFDVTRSEFPDLLRAHGVASAALARDGDTLFDPPLRYATGLLRINERTDAGSHRPLLGGENMAAVRAITGTDWTGKRHTALLVFGQGPEDAQSRTGAMGHVRLAIAAELFRRGLAPFIIVSGGNVHPNRTPFNEAVEMKRLLVGEHGVPADRILIEPHARHTTTNLRNSARLLLSAGFPGDRPALIVSDHLTIRYIGGPVLADRNLAEMGVRPGRITPGPNPFTLRFEPDPIAFHVEAAGDPLDP